MCIRDRLGTKDLILGVDALIAASVSFLAALASISIMMAWLDKVGFMPFVIYRIILGTALLIWVYAMS